VALGGALAFFGWPTLSLLPDVAARRFGAGGSGYSWLLSAVGAGALLGALTVATVSSGRGRRALLGIGATLSALGLVGLAFAPTLGAGVVCCVLQGGGLILFFATAQAALQLGAGDHNRGRIMGIWLMVLSGAHPLGHLLGGKLADLWGTTLVLGLQGAGIAVAALAALALALGTRPHGPGRGELT
jgi:MFS family permease